MKKIITVVLTALTALLVGCSDIATGRENAYEAHESVSATENINSEIVLGDKIENLFTLAAAQSRAAAGEELVANYMYFRCRTENADTLKWLYEKFEFLSIIPLDREILEGGMFYKDPELSEGECPWFYLMKPIEDYNEVVEKGLSVEVIDEMYLDEEDIAILSAEGLEIPEDGYLTVDVEDDASRGLWKKIKKFFKKYIANKPSGKVQVLDTITGEYVPVKGVKVVSQQLGVFGNDVTDKNGKFSIPKAYTSVGGKVQIMLVFENSNITLNAPEHLNALFASVVYYEDWHWIEGISDLNIRIKGEFNKQCATILNAYSDYCDYCKINGITTPTNLSIWTIYGMSGACAPLLRHTSGTALPSMSNSITNILGIPIPSGDKVFTPDILIGRKNATDEALTEDIYSHMFHELSHASHYFGLGVDGRRVWSKEYGDMASGWIKTALRGENPFDNCYNNGGTDLIKVIESWGYFSEYYIMQWKYPEQKVEVKQPVNSKIKDVKVPMYYDKLENRRLDTFKKDGKINRDNSKPYFYYGGFYDLIDTANIEYDDNGNIVSLRDFCSGYSYNELYRALTSLNVNNLNNFSNALVRIANRHSDLQNVIKTLEANHD